MFREGMGWFWFPAVYIVSYCHQLIGIWCSHVVRKWPLKNGLYSWIPRVTKLTRNAR